MTRPTDDRDELRRKLDVSEHALLDALRAVRAQAVSELPPITFTIDEAADALQMPADAVKQAARSGVLRAGKMSGRWAIALADLVDFENRRHDGFIDRAFTVAGSGRRRRRRPAATPPPPTPSPATPPARRGAIRT